MTRVIKCSVLATILAIAMISVSGCGRDEDNDGGDNSDGGDNGNAQTIVYTGAKDDVANTLTITEASRSKAYNPQSGDSYSLAAALNTSAGSLVSFNGTTL